MIAKSVAFLQRDFRIALSYRLSFIQTIVMLVFSLITLNFVGKLVDQGQPDSLAAYGNDYFGFALIGASALLFAQTAAGQFTSSIRGAQVTGTLEVMLKSRTSSAMFLFGSSLYGLTFAAIRLAVSLVVGGLLLGVDLRAGGIFTAIVVLALTVAIFGGLGILAGSFVLRFKQSDPISPFLITSSVLVSGVLYPTSLLPGWLEKISPLLPLTHTMSALRDALLADGSSNSATAGDIAVLAGFALLLPISLLVFELAVRSAKANGSLSHY
ncbi:MAG TPA: ABC transporter permease [Dehalococcoidia bacterium]|jgi:ABC-2 type transport system permease protein|nr:ABC transporter permease [Dehalococcoidia bacterium]